MQRIKCIESNDCDKFTAEVNEWLSQGWRVQSTSCGFVNSEQYSFCTAYFAVLLLDSGGMK